MASCDGQEASGHCTHMSETVDYFHVRKPCIRVTICPKLLKSKTKANGKHVPQSSKSVVRIETV